LTAANLSVSEGLRTVMDRCLKRNPSERPADADVLTAELNDVIKGAQGRGLGPVTKVTDVVVGVSPSVR